MDRIFTIGRDEVPRKVSLREGETLRWTLVVLPGVSCELALEMELCGEGIDVDIAGLYLCTSDERVNLRVDMRHESGLCTSRQLFKGIAGGSSRVMFDGRVYVRQDAQKTKAYQENHTMLLSRGASVETRPQLEIYADDVECSHGATTGFLSEEEQFYMRSRGIPEEDARRLQMISFLSPVLERLPEGMRDDIIEKI